MLFYTTFARRTFTVSLNELFENYTGRRIHVYSGRMTRLKYPSCLSDSVYTDNENSPCGTRVNHNIHIWCIYSSRWRRS